MLTTAVMIMSITALMPAVMLTVITVPLTAVPSPAPVPPSDLPPLPRPAISSAISGVPAVFSLISAAPDARLRKL
jgi:hypothetical protein